MNSTYYPTNHTFNLRVSSKTASDLGWYKISLQVSLVNYGGITIDAGYLILKLFSSTPCAFTTIN